MWILGAAAQPVDLGPALQQIGIGVLIAVPAFTMLWLLWKRNDRLTDELSNNQAQRVEDQKAQVLRERELAERLGPLLAEAVKVLATAPERFDQAMNQAQSAVQRGEVESWIRRIEHSVEGINQERNK